MDNLEKFINSVKTYLLFYILLENLFIIGVFWALTYQVELGALISGLICFVIAIILNGLLLSTVSNYINSPLRAIWQSIVYLSPTQHGITAPKPEELKIGRELTTSLVAQVYQLANIAEHSVEESKFKARDLHNNFIAQNLPLPIIVLDPSQTVVYANELAGKYIGMKSDDMIGKNIYMLMDMSFPSIDTFDTWLKEVSIKNATSSKSWERVRLKVRDDHPELLFDLAAYYNRDNPEKQETIMVLFDHTDQYSQDDQAVSFVALSVHELRTPLTLLRGYIEVFQEELGDNISPELQSFMLKMRASSEQLTAFVNNILNVARVDDDQLELKLHSEDWSTILKSAVEMISLRAKVRDISLNCEIGKDLPPVGVDSLSIREVINNLIDNAIKYSGDSKKIDIKSYLNKDGLIETTVQDYGVGVPTSVVPNLFTKFYRDHRNRAQIGGTGLGLYLSKAIVTAHGGEIWLRTKEGEGSTFGFTVMPYDKLAEELKKDGEGITRNAQGWIKNHSLYRR